MTYCPLKAEQHHLQAVWRYCGSQQFGPEFQEAARQLLPVRGADVVSQAGNELGDVVRSQRWSFATLLGGKTMSIVLTWPYLTNKQSPPQFIRETSSLFLYIKPLKSQQWQCTDTIFAFPEDKNILCRFVLISINLYKTNPTTITSVMFWGETVKAYKSPFHCIWSRDIFFNAIQ